MNKIEKLKAELRHYEKKYEELIEGHVQSEINKVDSDIKASISYIDLGRIQIDYKQFRFSFRYFFYTDGELFLRGNGKYIDHGYGYAKEKNKELRDVKNMYYMQMSIKKAVDALMKRHGIREYRDIELDVYVTGLTVALVEVINFCSLYDIKLVLYHYDKYTKNYYTQDVYLKRQQYV